MPLFVELASESKVSIWSSYTNMKPLIFPTDAESWVTLANNDIP